MHPSMRRMPLGLALAGLSAVGPQALAQTVVEPVIVTATRFPEQRLDAPIGARIITAEDIENSAARNLPDVLAKLGGLHARNSSGSPDQQLDLRGFGATGDDNTLVLLDGVRIEKIDSATRPLSGIPLQMIERIEILPGSGAVMCGAGATGGVINIVTKSAQRDQRSISAFAGAGTYDTREFRLGGTLAGENLGLTLNATRYRSDNYRRNNAVDQNSGMGDLSWRDADHRLSLRFGATRQTLGLPGSRTEAQLHTDRHGSATPDDRSRIESAFVTLAGSRRVGVLELSADVAYRDGSNDAEYPSFASDYHSDHHVFSASPRARWQGSLFGMPLQLVGGLDWQDWDWQSRSGGGFAAASKADQRSGAFYVQAAGDLTASTRLNAGWRAQRIRTVQRDVPPSAAARVSERRDLYANELGLRQRFGEAWSAHVKTARAFRVPNVDENFGFAWTGELLKPQTSKQNELGIEYTAKGVQASVTAYDIRLENEIAYMVVPPGFFANTNLSPTRRRGVEAALGWQPASRVDLGLRVQWLHATFRKGTYGGVDVSGNDVPLVPRHMADAHLTWEFLPATKLALHYTYVGRQRYDNDQANRFRHMPSYGLVDVRLSHDWKDWRFALDANNLLDKKYYSYGIVNGAFTSFNAYPQAGRTVFASVAYRY